MDLSTLSQHKVLIVISVFPRLIRAANILSDMLPATFLVRSEQGVALRHRAQVVRRRNVTAVDVGRVFDVQVDGDIPLVHFIHRNPVWYKDDGGPSGIGGYIFYIYNIAGVIHWGTGSSYNVAIRRIPLYRLIRCPAGDGDGILVALHHCEARLWFANQVVVIPIIPVLHRIGDGSRGQEKLYVVSQVIGKIKAVLILLLRIARFSPVVQISDILFKIHLRFAYLTVDLDGKLRFFIAWLEIEVELVAGSARLEIHMVYASRNIFLSAIVPAHNISYAGQFLDDDLVSVCALKITFADIEVSVHIGYRNLIIILIMNWSCCSVLLHQSYPYCFAAWKGRLYISTLAGLCARSLNLVAVDDQHIQCVPI